jgi:hypothetical protein
VELVPPGDVVGRKHPARGVLISRSQPTIVFITVCADKRARWIAQKSVQESLEQIWREADTCAPRDLNFTFQQWLSYWKSKFKRKHLDKSWRFQRDDWDTRLRRSESYTEKWNYIRENPVRDRLVAKVEDWPFWGMLNVLRW